MRRRRFFREVVVRLECGCVTGLNTGRYRVSKDMAAMFVGDAVRKGVWCFKHGGQCMPTEFLGVRRA